MLCGRPFKLSVAFDVRLFYFILIDLQYHESKMKACTSFIMITAVILCTSSSLFAQAPYTISWEKDGYIIGAGTITGFAALALDKSVHSLTLLEVSQLSRESVNWFDRNAIYRYSSSASHASDVLYTIAFAAPSALLADQSIRKDLQTITLMYLETFGWVGSVTELTKASVRRLRPFVYNPDVPFDNKSSSDSRKSFLSGHSSVAFASAAFISTVYSDYNPNSEWKPYIWAGSLLTASVVGILRYEAGAHFPTDIIASAVVGSVIGYTIPWLHRVGKENISIIPCAPGADYGFSMQIKF
jgi:membrane-associated phospholipid phosphatase